MNKLMVLIFRNQEKIDEAIEALRKLHSEHKLYASAVAVKSIDGKFSVQEITKEGHGGTRAAALIGALAGLFAGPAAATIMAAGGAVIGNAADLSAEDDFVSFANDIGNQVVRGGAAVVADVAEDDAPAFKATMEGLGGTALRS